MTTPIGYVLGTQEATPLEFWVAVLPGQVLRLDDVISVQTHRPDGGEIVNFYGVWIMSALYMKEHSLTQIPS